MQEQMRDALVDISSHAKANSLSRTTSETPLIADVEGYGTSGR